MLPKKEKTPTCAGFSSTKDLHMHPMPSSMLRRIVQQSGCWGAASARVGWTRSYAIRATTAQPVDTSKARIVAPSSLSFHYSLRKSLRRLRETLSDPKAKLDLSSADKDAIIVELLAVAKRSGMEVTEAWLRENIPIADSYTLEEIQRLLETPMIK